MSFRLHALVVLALACPCARGQTTWYVDPNVPGPGTGTLGDPYASLQYALVQSTTVSGDTIEVFPGTLVENVVHPADKDDLTFRALAGEVVIDGAGISSCYRSLGPGVSKITFEGQFTFQNGLGSASSNGSVGGGLRVQNGADLVLDGSLGGLSIVNNTADRGAGVYVADGDLRLTGCFVDGNDALGGPAAGGGVWFSSSSGADLLRLEESFVSNNRAELGGGIHVSNATLEASFTQISDNSALAQSQLGKAGGVAAVDSVVQLGIEAFVRANLAEGTGGGLALESSRLELSGGAGVLDNRAEPPACSGGALGGGVLGSCDSEIVGQGAELIQGNYACFEGGGVHGCAAVTGVILQDNAAQFGGGAHGGGCDPTYTDCVFRLNYGDAGTGSAGFGGGIYGPASVFNSTIADNIADGDGGGAHSCTLQSCYVTGNRTNALPFSAPAQGGGLYGCVANNCLITSNEAQLGGGAASSTLEGCDVAFNTARSPFDATVAPLGGGLFQCTASSSTLEGNIAETDVDGIDPEGGGAAFSTLDSVDVLDCVARDLTASGLNHPKGGGLAHCDALGCELRGNETQGADGSGGGAYGGSLTRCLLVGNSTYGGGGARNADLENCTVVANEAKAVGGGGEDVTARNCIFVQNVVGGFPDQLFNSTATYSLVEGGLAGIGNFDADPRFVDAPGGDYHLRFDSPCIDAGDPTTFDDDGSVADVGAFPFDPYHDRIGTTSCTSNANSTGQDAILTTYGSLVVADNLVLFQVTQLPANKFGYMLMSATPDFVPLFGGGQGNLCLGAPQIRFNQFVLNTGPTGVVGFQPDLTNLPQGTTILPGEDWYFQFWYRDNNPQLTNNTSSANQLLFQ